MQLNSVVKLNCTELVCQLRAWKFWAEKNRVAMHDLDFRLAGVKQVQIKKVTAIIERYGPQVKAVTAIVTAGKSPAEIAKVALLAGIEPISDEVEVITDDSDSSSGDEEDLEEEMEGRVLNKWKEGFSSGQMGIGTVKKEKKKR